MDRGYEHSFRVTGGKSTAADFILFWILPTAVMAYLFYFWASVHNFGFLVEGSTYLTSSLRERRFFFFLAIYLFTSSVVLFFLSRKRTLSISPHDIVERRMFGRKYSYKKSDIEKILFRFQSETNQFLGIRLKRGQNADIYFDFSKNVAEKTVRDIFDRFSYPVAAEREMIRYTQEITRMRIDL